MKVGDLTDGLHNKEEAAGAIRPPFFSGGTFKDAEGLKTITAPPLFGDQCTVNDI